MARILICTPLMPECLDSLQGHEIVEGPPGSDPAAEGLICGPTQVVDGSAQERMPALRAIGVAGAGADAIDLSAASSRGVTVLNAGPVLAATTADMAFGLIIAATRLMHDLENTLRTGGWHGWSFLDTHGRDVHGATLGLVGFGSIGRAVARRAEGFDMDVIHHTRHPTGQAGWVFDLDELLDRSDIVSIHVPLNEQTRHLIDRRRIDLVGPEGVLVNTARGAVVDEEALADALHEGRLLAAGLDVYEDEPNVSPRLLSAPRAVLLPHSGSATLSTRRGMLRNVAEQVAAFLS